MDVRYDREIRRGGHCYSERDQRGEGGGRGKGALKRREEGYCHLNTRSRKMTKLPTKQILRGNQHLKSPKNLKTRVFTSTDIERDGREDGYLEREHKGG